MNKPLPTDVDMEKRSQIILRLGFLLILTNVNTSCSYGELSPFTGSVRLRQTINFYNQDIGTHNYLTK